MQMKRSVKLSGRFDLHISLASFSFDNKQRSWLAEKKEYRVEYLKITLSCENLWVTWFFWTFNRPDFEFMDFFLLSKIKSFKFS